MTCKLAMTKKDDEDFQSSAKCWTCDTVMLVMMLK